MSQTSLGPWKLFLDMGSSNHRGLIIVPGQQANGDNLGMSFQFSLTHCILNRFSHTIYWKSPISILGTSGHEIYIFLEKNG